MYSKPSLLYDLQCQCSHFLIGNIGSQQNKTELIRNRHISHSTCSLSGSFLSSYKFCDLVKRLKRCHIADSQVDHFIQSSLYSILSGCGCDLSNFYSDVAIALFFRADRDSTYHYTSCWIRFSQYNVNFKCYKLK